MNSRIARVRVMRGVVQTLLMEIASIVVLIQVLSIILLIFIPHLYTLRIILVMMVRLIHHMIYKIIRVMLVVSIVVVLTKTIFVLNYGAKTVIPFVRHVEGTTWIMNVSIHFHNI